ncbi:MAG: type II toxin-antitoxin system VapC family toxin [Thermoprotei archaeon]|nr:type II toxin-antitoxin system VapC family toxin [Thermoprotei archaeon]
MLERVKKIIVVDASVAVKWFVPERYYEKALELRDAYLNGKVDLISPSLIIYEVANALRFHRVYKLTLEDIVNAVKDIINLDIIRKLTLEGWLKAIKLSIDKDISIYDAIYGAMTLIFNGILVTSDEKLSERIKDTVRVVTLDELSL